MYCLFFFSIVPPPPISVYVLFKVLPPVRSIYRYACLRHVKSPVGEIEGDVLSFFFFQLPPPPISAPVLCIRLPRVRSIYRFSPSLSSTR